MVDAIQLVGTNTLELESIEYISLDTEPLTLILQSPSLGCMYFDKFNLQIHFVCPDRKH